MTTLAHPAAPVKPARKPRSVKPAHGTTRLELIINTQGYVVRFLPTDPAAGVSRLIYLHKVDGPSYHVHRDVHGCGCTCPDFTFSRDGVDPAGCKHVKALAAVGLL